MQHVEAPGDDLPIGQTFRSPGRFLNALTERQKERLRWTMERQGLKTVRQVWNLFFQDLTETN